MNEGLNAAMFEYANEVSNYLNANEYSISCYINCLSCPIYFI